MRITDLIITYAGELVVGIVFIVVAIVTAVATYKGLITFGKPERSKDCSNCFEHTAMIENIVKLCDETTEINDQITIIKNEIVKISKQLNNLIIHHALINGKDLT